MFGPWKFLIQREDSFNNQRSWSPEISPEWTYWMTIFDCQNNQPYHVFGYRRKTAIVTSTSASKFLWQILRIKIVTQFAELWAFKHNTFRSRLWVHENLGYSPKDWKNPRKHQSLGSENNPASSFVNITKLSVLHNQLKSQVKNKDGDHVKAAMPSRSKFLLRYLTTRCWQGKSENEINSR